MDLLSMASCLYQSGYSVLASRNKVPAHRWRWADDLRREQIGRSDLYTMAQHAVMAGRADSLSVRMDADTAALDLDFHSEELTECFVGLFDRYIDTPYTVRGKKGCKIFFRMDSKDGVERTVAVGQTLYPQGQPGCLNNLEVKLDISAVYGRHSEGILYGPYGGYAAVWETAPGLLPHMTMAQIEWLLGRAADELGYSGSPRVTEDDLRKTAACLSLSGRHGFDIAWGFAAEFGTEFMLAALSVCWGRGGDGPFGQAAREFVKAWEHDPRIAADGYAIFGREMDAMLMALTDRGGLEEDDMAQTDPLAIYGKYAKL